MRAGRPRSRVEPPPIAPAPQGDRRRHAQAEPFPSVQHAQGLGAADGLVPLADARLAVDVGEFVSVPPRMNSTVFRCKGAEIPFNGCSASPFAGSPRSQFLKYRRMPAIAGRPVTTAIPAATAANRTSCKP